MLNLPNLDQLQLATKTERRASLRALLADRLADIIHCGLESFTHLLVVEAQDSERQIVEAVGFSPLVSRIDNHRNDLDCDWLERHDGWWELLYVVGNSGFAYILLVEDHPDQPLARLCRAQEVTP